MVEGGSAHRTVRPRLPGLKRTQDGQMPSLLRFLFVIGVLAGLVYGGMLALVTLFEPQPREITIVVPPDRFMKR